MNIGLIHIAIHRLLLSSSYDVEIKVNYGNSEIVSKIIEAGDILVNIRETIEYKIGIDEIIIDVAEIIGEFDRETIKYLTLDLKNLERNVLTKAWFTLVDYNNVLYNNV